MADRVTKVVLTAQVQGYVAGMNRAKAATAETAKGAEKLARQESAFKGLGRGMLIASAAVTAMGVAAAKTGLEYNALQQRSRAALKSILGSAEAANAQMDKLDEFARNSPFSKATFIKAQQQMLAFGIETKKVIPYLDAVQNAVAAAGGSNVEIEAIVATMSKIQSSAKLTAEDLNEFGNRGVDAAGLIGAQMGKTGAQIRQEITAGTLDATVALDALVAGMSEKFDGAADNVKQTWDGAVDRLKAAWRDFGAELAKPLVDPNGGGALVDLVNKTADILRGFEKLPDPVKNTATALVIATTAAAALGGAAILAVPKVAAFRASLIDLGVSAATTDKAMRGAAIGFKALGVAGAIAAVSSMSKDLADAAREALGLKATVDSLKESLDEVGASKTIDELIGDGLGSLTDNGAFSDFLRQGEQAIDWAEDWNVGMQLAGVETQLMTAKLKEADALMAELVSAGRVDEAGALFEALAAKTNGSQEALDRLNGLLPEYNDAQASAAEATGEGATELQEFTSQAETAQAALDAFVGELERLGQTQLTVNEANRQVQASLDEFRVKLEENGATLDITTEAGRENSAALDGIAQSYLKAAAATVENTGRQSDAIPIIEDGRQAIIDAGIAAGLSADQASAYADELGLIPGNVSTVIRANWDEAIRQANAVAQAIRDIPGRRDIVINEQVQQTGAARGLVGGAFPGNANGAVYAYASGGFASGIYAGRPGAIHKFAEPETRWEAYISGKPGMEERNRGIALEALERLGGAPGGVGAGGDVSVNLDGMRLRLDVGGKQIEGVIRQEAAAVVSGYEKQSQRATARGWQNN